MSRTSAYVASSGPVVGSRAATSSRATATCAGVPVSEVFTGPLIPLRGQPRVWPEGTSIRMDFAIRVTWVAIQDNVYI